MIRYYLNKEESSHEKVQTDNCCHSLDIGLDHFSSEYRIGPDQAAVYDRSNAESATADIDVSHRLCCRYNYRKLASEEIRQNEGTRANVNEPCKGGAKQQLLPRP